MSNKVLSQTEMSVLKKSLLPTPNIINGADLRWDFNKFSRKMRCKWYFRDEPSKDFHETPTFRSKCAWKPARGDPCVELYLNEMEHELFSFLLGKRQSYNLTKEKWEALKKDKAVILKPADTGSCVVVWDREDYLARGYKQLFDEYLYVDVKHSNDKTLSDLNAKSNNFLKRLSKKNHFRKEIEVLFVWL